MSKVVHAPGISYKEHGPTGPVFAIMTLLIAAAVGPVWQEPARRSRPRSPMMVRAR